MTVLPLPQLEPDQQAEIIDIRSNHPARLARLSAYGLTPGSHVTLRQRHFACVIMVGETEIALDMDVARDILVCPR